MTNNDAAVQPLKGAIHVDLKMLADSLRPEGRHRRFVAAVDRAAAAGSIRQDLFDALRALRIIERIQDAVDDESPVAVRDETTIAGALFTYSVILYGRATFASSRHRVSLLGVDGLSDDDHITHDLVKSLRNDALAHFGRADELEDGPLVKEAVLLSFTRTKKQVGCYTTRAQHKVEIAARLASLIERRLAQIAERQQELFDAADGELQKAVSADPTLGPSLPNFRFSAESFCASPEAAAKFEAGLESGSMEDLDYTVSVPRPSRRT